MIHRDYYFSFNTGHHLNYFTIKVNDETINEVKQATTLRFSQRPAAGNRAHFQSKNFFSPCLNERINSILRDSKQGTQVPTEG